MIREIAPLDRALDHPLFILKVTSDEMKVSMVDDDKTYSNNELTPFCDEHDEEWEDLDVSASVAKEQVLLAAVSPTTSETSGEDQGLRRRHRRPSPPRQHQADSLGRRHLAESTPGPYASSVSSNSRRRANIVDHPMQRIAGHFFIHLCRKIYWIIQLALACCMIGCIFQLIEWCFYYALHPERLAWTVTALLGAGIPLFFYYKPKLEVLLRELGNSSSQLDSADVLGRFLDFPQLKAVAAVVFFVIPLVFELRTLHFLANLVGGSVAATVLFLVVLCGWFGLEWKRHNEDVSNATRPLSSPHKRTQTSFYLLYGSALFVPLYHGTEKRHIPALAARFFLATAVLLWKTASTFDPSQAVRAALRHTVRDALQEVGTSVQQDELLQLTMLRWIVDYWSSSPQQQQQQSSSNSGSRPAFSVPDAFSKTAGRRPSRVVRSHQDLDWTELWDMLQTTTNQMSSEVETLQHHSPQALSQGDVPSSITSTQLIVSTSRNSSSPRESQQFNDSVRNLQTMLASMNLDVRAKPAVRGYKRAVEAFPPSRSAATALGAARRCPAIMLLCFYILFRLLGLYLSPFTAMLILLPFSTFETWRVRMWVEGCKQAMDPSSTDLNKLWYFESVDPMTILLMDESFCLTARLPTLLVVWQNVCASVETLEVSLTAARCVQTTVVAVDFAANIISLASFGYEVSQHGWLHGLEIVAKELMHLHSTGTVLSTLSHGISTPIGASYTSAAVSAVRNSQTMSRNLRVLLEEENTSKVIGPVLGLLAQLIGQGWLWGRDRHESIQVTPREPRSTLEIVELDEEGEEANPSGQRAFRNHDSLITETETSLLTHSASVESTGGEWIKTMRGKFTHLMSNSDEDATQASFGVLAEVVVDKELESSTVWRRSGDTYLFSAFQFGRKSELSRAKGHGDEADVPPVVDVHTTCSVAPSGDILHEANLLQDAFTPLEKPETEGADCARINTPVADDRTLTNDSNSADTASSGLCDSDLLNSFNELISNNSVAPNHDAVRSSPALGGIGEEKESESLVRSPSPVEFQCNTSEAVPGNADNIIEEFETASSEMMGPLAQCDEHSLRRAVRFSVVAFRFFFTPCSRLFVFYRKKKI